MRCRVLRAVCHVHRSDCGTDKRALRSRLCAAVSTAQYRRKCHNKLCNAIRECVYVCVCVCVCVYCLHLAISTFLSSAATTPHEFIITDDFNINLDDHLVSSSQQFTDLLSSTNLTQHVSVSTHIHNHTLNLVITSSHTNLSPTISHSLSLYLITFLFSLTSTLHPRLLHPLLNLPSVAPKILI